jgi:imidazolonepropionase-like amidohydrolase
MQPAFITEYSILETDMTRKQHDTKFETITRKDFIKLGSAAAALVALGGIEGCASASILNVPAMDYTKDILIENATVIDVARGKAIPGSRLLIRNGIIQALETRDIPAGNAMRIDARGAFIIPGLIDAHCHPTITAAFGVDSADLSRIVAFQKRQFTIGPEYGITTYRDMGSFPITLHGLIKDIDGGRLNGPRVSYCNSILNINGGHPDIPPTDAHPLANFVALFTGMVMTNFKDFEDLKKVIEKNAKGASFIKLTMDNVSAFCRTGEIPVYTDEMLDYIFNYAERTGLPVSGHNHRKWGFDRAMKYPFNSLEHIVSDAYLSDRDIEVMAKKKISIVPTMTVGLCYCMEEAYDTVPEKFRTDFIMNELKIRKNYLYTEALEHCDPVIHNKNMAELKKYKSVGYNNLWKNKIHLVNPELYFGMILYGTKNLQKLREAGINIGFGIDAGMPFAYFGGQYRELEFLSRAGFKNDEILRVATINSARILRLQDRIGTIEKSKLADLVFLTVNPLEDVRAYRSPEIVMKEGKFVFSKKALPVKAAVA